MLSVMLLTAGGCIAISARADELGDLKAQVEALSARIADLESQRKADNRIQQNENAPAPVVPPPLPFAMQTDQNGTPVSSSNAITLYDNSNTSLRVYGLLEATITHVNNQTPGGGVASGFQAAWFSGNRLGFDGTHALDAGQSLGMPDLKIIAKLESQFELATGSSSVSNTIFNRDAWLGVFADELGKVTVGRQNTLTRDFTETWGDAYGTDEVGYRELGYSNVNNFVSFIGYSGSPTGSRLDSAIVWKKKWDDHWVTGLAYGFGAGGVGGAGAGELGGTTPGDFTKGTSEQASVAYNALQLGPVKVNANLSYDRANVSDLIHQSELVGGNLLWGYLRVNGGFVHYTAQQGVANRAGERTDNSWTVSAGLIPGGKMEYDIGFQEMNGNHAGFNAQGRTLSPFGDTSLVTTFANGGKNTLYSSVIYHADKQTDVYLVSDFMRVKGGWRIPDALNNGAVFGTSGVASDELEVGIGARYKF